MTQGLTRRAAVSGALAAAMASPAISQARRPAIAVVGGGFAGGAAARALAARGFDVTLVEPSAAYVACPLSNAVIGGLRSMSAQTFGYEGLRKAGIRLVTAAASAIDAEERQIRLETGDALSYDRLVLAPGIEARVDGALPGYAAGAEETMPHAWKAGPQTALLARQLAAMKEGGTVLMAIPANPYRCPPGPYERASLIAHFLERHNPRAKLILLDAKDAFSKRSLFQAAWAELYPGLIEWVPLSGGGKVTEVDVGAMSLVTEFGRHRGDVVNVIPPQRAAPIAVAAGVADRSGWCPIDPMTFESRLRPGIHVVGDAAIMGAIPKSAFAAHGEALAAAEAIAALAAGVAPPEPRLINTCYSLVAPDYGISVAGVYRPAANGLFADIAGAGGASAADAGRNARRAEAAYAEGWFRRITADVFG
jgi:sulfide dehydrogenase [flavocytochrome c] flavoprotein subunit